jgi:hypothetical protein
MSPLRALDRALYPEAPAERLAVLRIMVGAFAALYLLVRFPSFVSVARLARHDFAPVGPLFWLEEPLSRGSLTALTALAVAAGFAFALGFRYRVSGPLFAVLFGFLTTYRCSFGMKFHTENLVFLQVLVLSVAPAADALSLDARGRTPPGAHGRYGWAPRAAALLTVVTYVLAGVAKLRLGGADWLGGEVLQGQIAYDNLRKIELGSWHSPLGVLLVPFTGLFAVLAWLTMAVELGAPVALLGGRPALVWSLLAWGFHVSVLALMMIAFAYPLSTVPYWAFFRVERVLDTSLVRRMIRRVSKADSPDIGPVRRD